MTYDDHVISLFFFGGNVHVVSARYTVSDRRIGSGASNRATPANCWSAASSRTEGQSKGGIAPETAPRLHPRGRSCALGEALDNLSFLDTHPDCGDRDIFITQFRQQSTSPQKVVLLFDRSAHGRLTAR